MQLIFRRRNFLHSARACVRLDNAPSCILKTVLSLDLFLFGETVSFRPENNARWRFRKRRHSRRTAASEASACS